MKLRSLCCALFFLIVFGLSAQHPGSGNTLNFDGNNDYVQLNSSYGNLSLPLSFAFWYKKGPNQSGPIRFFTTHDMTGAYRGLMVHEINGALTVMCGNGVNRSPSGRFGWVCNHNFITGRWYHVTAVVSSVNSAQFYINGNPVTTTANNGTGTKVLSTNNSNGRIGSNTAGNNITYLSGQLDEFSFWDKALSQTEIRDMMCRKLSGTEPNLLTYFRFDDGAGTTLTNLKAGGPNGTLTNGPAWVASSAPVGDRSYYNYNGTNPAIGHSLSGDSIVISPNPGGASGTQLYLVDTLPLSHQGISIPAGVDYYFGVFNAFHSKSYDVDLFPGPVSGALPYNSVSLATRPDNAAPAWTLTNASNLPDFSLGQRNTSAQYIIADDPCPIIGPVLGNDTSVCPNSNFKIGRPMQNGDQYTWSNGAGSDSITVNSAGTYWLNWTDASGCSYGDTITIGTLAVTNNFFPDDTVICDSLYLLVSGPYVNFNWSNGSAANSASFFSTGLIWFTAEDTISGCTVTDTLDAIIESAANIPAALPADTVICEPGGITLSALTAGALSYEWYDGSQASNHYFDEDGQYWVKRTFAGGCEVIDYMNIQFQEAVEPLSDSIYEICENDSLVLSISTSDFSSVQWSTGQNTHSATFYQTGTYFLEAYTPLGCLLTDSFEIAPQPGLDSMQIFSDTSFCHGGSLWVEVPIGLSLQWGDGLKDSRQITRPGNYRVEISDGCTESVEYFTVDKFDCNCQLAFPSAFTPNGDGMNESIGPGTLCDFRSYRLEIFDRFGKMVFSSNDPEGRFDGTLDGRECPEGVFTYHIKFSTPNGSSTIYGYFSLLR